MKLITPDGTVYPLTQPLMTIGRDPGCNIVLAHDDRVSRQHAQLQVGGGQVVVTDLNSRNGTFVNGARLAGPHPLGPGDVLTVGGTNFTFQAEQDPLATRADLTPYAPPVPAPAQPVTVPYPVPYPGYAPPVPAPAQPVAVPYPVPYPGYAPRPPKDRSLAIILELVPGLFGLLGIGWIYAENTSTGIVFLLMYLMLAIFFAVANIFSYGICCLITLPIQIIFIVLSVVMLNDYTHKRTDLFG